MPAAILDSQKRIKALEERRAANVARMQAMVASGEDLDGDSDTAAEYKALDQAVAADTAAISREQRLQKHMEATAAVTPAAAPTPAAGGAPPIKVEAPNFTKDPKAGFETPRDFFQAILANGRRDPRAANDERLRFLAAVGSDEQSVADDAYGGFLVPTAHSGNVLELAPEDDPTAALTTNVPMGAPKVEIPARVDKNHNSSVAGGITVSREQETGQFASSRMKFEKVGLNATALVGLSYTTQDLLTDSPQSIAALLANGFRQAYADKIFQEKITGGGAGQFLGVLNAPCTVEIAKEGGQAAATINGTNIIKMRARCWRYGRAIWLANHDTYTQLASAHISLTNDDRAIFVPGNGVDVPDTLLGRPIYFTEYCKTLGTAGDLVLGVWSEYLTGTYEAMQQAASMHVRFDYHESAFKFWTRNDGRPWWLTAMTPKNSSSTLSPFVTLATRA